MTTAKNRPDGCNDDADIRYTFARDYRLLDFSPMENDKPALVFDRAHGQWVDFDGLFGELSDSIPVTAKEATRYCQDGTIPAEVRRLIENDVYAPDPEED